MLENGMQYNMELYVQANARLHRQGQKQKVIIHQLVVVGGVDEDVAIALEGKINVQDALMDSLKARIGGR
jgi:SNF2 family DNA or RNA helicase